MSSTKSYVISLGGSLIVPPEGIDWKFLKSFRKLILKEIKNNKRFFLITGGGYTCRQYNEAANKVRKVAPEDLDWLGIHSSRLNAHLIRTIFRDVAHPEIIKNPTIHMSGREKVTVAGGWKPGWSTDYVATMIAQEYETDTIINLTNIDYAYTKDPKKHSDAEKITDINWKDFRKLVGNKWKPGLNTPFDPIASKKGEKLGLQVALLNGHNLSNLENFLKNKDFKGTLIR